MKNCRMFFYLRIPLHNFYSIFCHVHLVENTTYSRRYFTHKNYS